MRLRSDIWVDALVRRAQAGGAFVYVARRGDDMAGAVLIKVGWMTGQAKVLSPSQDADGNRVWLLVDGTDEMEEAKADAYIRRRTEKDPDLWVIEIEDKQGRPFVDEPIIHS